MRLKMPYQAWVRMTLREDHEIRKLTVIGKRRRRKIRDAGIMGISTKEAGDA